MQIIKRNGDLAIYDRKKIEQAIEKAFASTNETYEDKLLQKLVCKVEQTITTSDRWKSSPNVELIQDIVEQILMESGYYNVAKNYILYRENRTKQRADRASILNSFTDFPKLHQVLKDIQMQYGEAVCPLYMLAQKFHTFEKPEMKQSEKLQALIKAAVELTTMESPKWEMVAAQLLLLDFQQRLQAELEKSNIHCFYEKVELLSKLGLYGTYLIEAYSKEEFQICADYVKEERNQLFNYSGLELLLQRYVIRNHDGKPLETPQEMFLGIAMHLAMKEEKNRLQWVKRFYDMLSTLKVTMATPTLSNARKPYYQLSSCFIDTVPDSLDGIYRSLDNFAKVSKFGGGMGLYFGKVRATGSSIRGFKGVAGGVIRWIRLVNDTAVAVDQLGMRQGAVAVYLDAWHKDLPEFLALRTNNGDDRMKAHDIFPAICYPNLFWKQARESIEGDWYLMCPHEILTVRGYALEDSYGEVWEKRYFECISDPRISKRVIPIKEIIRLMIKSAVETGTPFVFNRDIVNQANPNSHNGMIYCSNLCTEIAQNMSAMDLESQYIETMEGDKVVVTKTVPGDFVVCNLASLSLGNIDIDQEQELQEIIESAVRALDNVIDLNYFPLPYAKITTQKYRSIGLGISGYHHMLAKHHIRWESNEHLEFVDKLFEKINYFAILASSNLAKEKGAYEAVKGSDWSTGTYFTKRNYTTTAWKELEDQVRENGMRNAYLMAIAPTSSTSIIAGTTAGVDPIMHKYFLEEKKQGLLPRVAPELSEDSFWYYKNAHLIDQLWSIKACGIRQRHIDQSQSMNLYITNEYTFRKVLNLYIKAYEEGIKTVYYIRSKSLEVEECESCSS